MRVVIAIGSNMQSEANVRSAVTMLGQRLDLLAVSRVYETQPVGTTEQHRFLNAALMLETELEPSQLRTVLEDLEGLLGRVRTADKFGPRTIDLDIALAWCDGAIAVLDPGILRYAHIARPLADLVPELRLGPEGRRVDAPAASLSEDGLVWREDIDLGTLLKGDRVCHH